MKKIKKDYILSVIINGTINISTNGHTIGKISKGEVRGEWWCEPTNGALPELIKGKANAVTFLKQSAINP